LELGYKTVVDVREESEKFTGAVERRAKEQDMRYVNIPVSRETIRIEDVIGFYRNVYEKLSAPLYVFSRLGRKPLAFLLLFEAVAQSRPLVWIFQRASRIGIDLRGDMVLQSFLINFYNAGSVEEVVAEIQKLRPDLIARRLGEDSEGGGPSTTTVERATRADRLEVLPQTRRRCHGIVALFSAAKRPGGSYSSSVSSQR